MRSLLSALRTKLLLIAAALLALVRHVFIGRLFREEDGLLPPHRHLLQILCPYCRRDKGVFKELKQSPHVVELDEREDGWTIQDALSEIMGRRTVPQVFINGKHVGGSDDTVEAYQNGQLAKLLGIEAEIEDDL